jgi:hypothetical protein
MTFWYAADSTDALFCVAAHLIFAFPQALLCRHRWGNFVVGTEHDRAAMDVIQKFIGDAFTQSRSIIKKEVRRCYLISSMFSIWLQIVKSVETPRVKGSQTHIATLRPNATHTTIYQLTKTIIQKLSGSKVVSIPITPALCGRIALMVCPLFLRLIPILNTPSTSGM